MRTRNIFIVLALISELVSLVTEAISAGEDISEEEMARATKRMKEAHDKWTAMNEEKEDTNGSDTIGA